MGCLMVSHAYCEIDNVLYSASLGVVRWHYRPAKKKILCAEIALERRNSHEIWGKLEWFDHVLTLPKTSHVVKVLAATV